MSQITLNQSAGNLLESKSKSESFSTEQRREFRMAEVASTQVEGPKVLDPHAELCHTIMLLRLATTYNYSHSMLPNKNYELQFDPNLDHKYRKATYHGTLNALAAIFVMGAEVIALAAFNPADGSAQVIATLEAVVDGVVVIKNQDTEKVKKDSTFEVITPDNPVDFVAICIASSTNFESFQGLVEAT